MIVRLVLGIGLAVLTYWLLRRVLGKYQLSVKQFFAIYGLALGTLILVALALSGRLHPIAAALGGTDHGRSSPALDHAWPSSHEPFAGSRSHA